MAAAARPPGSRGPLAWSDTEGLLLQAPVAIAVVEGPRLVFRFANPAYLRLVNREGLAGRPYFDAFPEVAGTAAADVLQRVLDEGEPYQVDRMPVQLDIGRGVEERFFRFNLQPLRDEAGAVRGIMAVSVDVTDHVQAERDAATQEQLLRTMLDGLPVLAWTARPDGWLDFYNRRWYEYAGTTPQQMEGWGWRFVHDPHELPRVMERWLASVQTGQP
ncbi:MAG TPA: PAS domain-containing protein [Candidatus Thermoplasmatota archaeon]|nr:PAS domain-containing protein [Candidatus Thermoplasmatota archaeon]